MAVLLDGRFRVAIEFGSLGLFCRALKLIRLLRISKAYKMTTTSEPGFQWWEDIKYSLRSIIKFTLYITVGFRFG